MLMERVSKPVGQLCDAGVATAPANLRAGSAPCCRCSIRSVSNRLSPVFGTEGLPMGMVCDERANYYYLPISHNRTYSVTVQAGPGIGGRGSALHSQYSRQSGGLISTRLSGASPCGRENRFSRRTRPPPELRSRPAHKPVPRRCHGSCNPAVGSSQRC